MDSSRMSGCLLSAYIHISLVAQINAINKVTVCNGKGKIIFIYGKHNFQVLKNFLKKLSFFILNTKSQFPLPPFLLFSFKPLYTKKFLLE